tara:strand:- start:933 stop:1163 length:231 start_codon:yes stop_codon:yes gene_type:complete
MMKDELVNIESHWEEPSDWSVDVDDEMINVLDTNKDFVVSSVRHNFVQSAVEDHLKEAYAAASIDLLLSICDEVDA